MRCCMFCDEKTDTYVAFGTKGFACLDCIYKYDLERHPFTGGICDTEDRYWSFERIWKPKRCQVLIEEIPYNGNLADNSKFMSFNAKELEGKKRKCPVQVEITYF